MRIGDGQTEYQWVENWAKIPDSESASTGWAHHDVAVTAEGNVISFHPGDSTMLVFDAQGKLSRSWETNFADAHGMTIVVEDGTEYLWVADNGRKRSAGLAYEYASATKPGGPPRHAHETRGQAVKMTLQGEIVQAISRPELAIYETGVYSPTSIAVNGSNGDVWVADGYGMSYVHRFDRAGTYIGSINGEEGGGRFNTPHGLFIDTRKSEPELYIADRGNGRVQVYDLDGNFKRVFGSDFLTTPSAFGIFGETLIVAELKARLAVVDVEDKLVGYLGENLPVADVQGWPNNLNDAGTPVRTALLESGKFNSPHGMAIDSTGNVYVSEWLIGGRFIKLARLER
jgi:DNA-binding beta-propeller fold protein YncE